MLPLGPGAAACCWRITCKHLVLQRRKQLQHLIWAAARHRAASALCCFSSSCQTHLMWSSLDASDGNAVSAEAVFSSVLLYYIFHPSVIYTAYPWEERWGASWTRPQHPGTTAHIHTYGLNSESPINLTSICTSSDCVRKQEHLQNKHTTQGQHAKYTKKGSDAASSADKTIQLSINPKIKWWKSYDTEI